MDDTMAPDMSVDPAAGAGEASKYNVLDFDDEKATVETANGPMTIARTPGVDSMLGIDKLSAPVLDELPIGPLGGSRSTVETGALPAELVSSQNNASFSAPAPKLEVPKVLAHKQEGAGPMGMMREGMKLQLKGIDKEKDAARLAAEAEAEAFQLEHEHLMGRSAAQKAHAEKEADEIKKIQLKADQDAAELDKDAKRIAEMKIDNDRIYKGNAGKKILHILASFGGALGSAITKSPNYAQEAIDNEIQADIRSQAAEIANAKDVFALKKNAIAERMQRGMTFTQAKTATHFLQLQAAETKLRGLMASTHNQDVAARYEQMLAKLLEKKGQVLTQFGAMSAQMAAAMAGKRPQDARFVPRGDGGFYAASPEAAAKLREGIGATNSVKADIKRMRQLLMENNDGNESFGAKAKEYEVLRARMIAGLNKASGLGALDKGSIEFLEAQVPDATAFFGTGSGSLDRLKALEHSLNGELEGKLQAEGGY